MQSKKPYQSKIVLRGGKTVFNRNTLIGNWEEDREEKPTTKFHLRPGFETTKGCGEMEALGQGPRHYGNGIPSASQGTKSVIHYQDRSVIGKVESISQMAFQGGEESTFKKHFGIEHVLRPPLKLQREVLEEYRSKWCGDSTSETRFLTEKTFNQNKANGSTFQMSHIRRLPRVPVFVQDIQQALIFQHGCHAIHLAHKVFRCYDADRNKLLSKKEFSDLIKDLDIKLSHDEFDATFRYFDKDSSGQVDYEEFIDTLSGRLSQTRESAVLEAWQLLDADNLSCVNAFQLIDCFRLHSNHPSISKDPLLSQIPTQFVRQWNQVIDTEGETKSDGNVTKEEFILYYRRLSPSIFADDLFVEIVKASWGL